MTKFRFLKAGAIGALASSLLLTALPASAQDGRGWGSRGRARAERAAGRADTNNGARGWAAQREAAPAPQRSQGMGGSGFRGPAPRAETSDGNRGWAAQRGQGLAGPGGGSRAPGADVASTPAARNSTYTAPRDRSYGMAGRGGNWQGQRQAAQPAPQPAPAAAAQVRGYARTGDWNRDRNGRGDDARRADWQRDGSDQARRAERRDDARNYASGYRDGRRDDNRWDNRYGNDNRRWDSRGWRNDNRYDWYRYRAANRGIYSLGRYYSPYRGYTYSRISIGFTLGSLFYSNRYWINDPWQYRLPPVYGGYRWVRYYDDALLVDTYSGQVVDVIYDFFW